MADILPVTAGVVGPDPAIGGRDSSNEAPNEDVGLKGFNPPSPVMCDLTDDVEPGPSGVAVECDVLAAPVGWDDSGVEYEEPKLVADFVPSVP
jgi:hypothetical protein